MPKTGKKLKVVEISKKNENQVAEEKPAGSITDAQELTMIKEEIEKEEPIIKEEIKEENIEKQVETPVETSLEELKTDKKKKSAEYMREYRKVKQAEQKKLKEDLKQKTEIIENIVEKPTKTPIEKQPQIVERIIEKAPRIIKEAPDYNNIPEEIILKEIRKRQVTQKEQRQTIRQENMKRIAMNIA